MKHYITPEQITSNTDVPHAIVDFPYRYVRMDYSDEAGGYASVPVPDNWTGTMMARVWFRTNGSATVQGATISCNFVPFGGTNNAQGSVFATTTGPSNEIIGSNIVELDCSNASGEMMSVRIGPDINTTTENEPVDIVLVELFIGTY